TAVNRGINLLVAAAVTATRYVALKSDLYLEQIFKIRRIVNRCGRHQDIEAQNRLEELIEGCGGAGKIDEGMGNRDRVIGESCRRDSLRGARGWTGSSAGVLSLGS